MMVGSFNTQPPEGGCVVHRFYVKDVRGFNTQPPEGGCVRLARCCRLRAGFNTQPPEGGCVGPQAQVLMLRDVSTHSRPKAAAEIDRPAARIIVVSTHSRPKAAARGRHVCGLGKKFQHTAARRRLPACTPASVACYSFNTQPPEGGCPPGLARRAGWQCFNTQPPEGGCFGILPCNSMISCFNTQPPEGGCSLLENSLKIRQLEATFR